MQVVELSIDAGYDKNPSTDFMSEWARLEVPALELPAHAYGGTGYIDGLLPDDMTHPVMKGVDRNWRPFVAVRVQTRSPVRHRLTESNINVEVYFQRYRADDRIWVSGGPLSLMVSNMRESDKAVLQELLRGQFVTIEHKDETYKLV